jgi:hypothetical protein
MAVVNAEEAQWCIDLVTTDILNIVSKFEAGDVGQGVGAQVSALVKILEDYMDRPYSAFKKNKEVEEKWHNDRVIALSYLQTRAFQLSVFYNDPRGATRAIKETLEHLVEKGVISQVPPIQVMQRYGKRKVMYYVEQ